MKRMKCVKCIKMHNNNERRSAQIQRIYDNSQLDIAVPLNRDRCIPHSTGHSTIK